MFTHPPLHRTLKHSVTPPIFNTVPSHTRSQILLGVLYKLHSAYHSNTHTHARTYAQTKNTQAYANDAPSSNLLSFFSHTLYTTLYSLVYNTRTQNVVNFCCKPVALILSRKSTYYSTLLYTPRAAYTPTSPLCAHTALAVSPGSGPPTCTGSIFEFVLLCPCCCSILVLVLAIR